MFRKGKSAVKDDSKISWSGIETEVEVEWEEAGLLVSLVGIHWEEGSLTFAPIERKSLVLTPALQSKQSSLCGLHCSRDQRGGPNGQIISIKRQLTEEVGKQEDHWWKERKIKNHERILMEHLNKLERNGFCVFDKLRKCAYQKEKIESKEQSKKGGQTK